MLVFCYLANYRGCAVRCFDKEELMSIMKKTLFDYLNSPFSLLIAGFLLTTLVGSYINHAFHAESWKSQARFEIFKERLKEANEAQSSMIVLSNKRITLLGQRRRAIEKARIVLPEPVE